MRGGGIVLERTFAEALGVGVGGTVTLDGRPYRVVGIAVTAASPPYPNMCYPPGGDCDFDYQGNLIAPEPRARVGHRAGCPVARLVRWRRCPTC